MRINLKKIYNEEWKNFEYLLIAVDDHVYREKDSRSSRILLNSEALFTNFNPLEKSISLQPYPSICLDNEDKDLISDYNIKKSFIKNFYEKLSTSLSDLLSYTPPTLEEVKINYDNLDFVKDEQKICPDTTIPIINFEEQIHDLRYTKDKHEIYLDNPYMGMFQESILENYIDSFQQSQQQLNSEQNSTICF